MNVRFFDDHLEKFIRNLERRTIARVLRTIDLLELFGNELGMPHSRKIGGRLLELRVRGQQEVRILYVFHKDRAVLLHGFVKKSQKMSRRVLQLTQQKLRVLDSI
ncbi:MAG: hypothetical protein A3C90_01525 [Candidatus Magasanikbacteria bacterium RIFCSPHIGHO2_02_FULL_51_14]|uniref:Addiction module toxin RelE n=1 Tax=Candidatus Magasanikbacteria bacterium RIFCSPHIGHO2_02_FULL_51_14 TaxID=1798683 RepID=A0A1F6MHJ2_9BACT|nr:MAG: hypothetical protein A3C90_01525 [Candidatus Magasanikbacteria bacterium RIFCSPHIGHO2_02_FULL_51_14]